MASVLSLMVVLSVGAVGAAAAPPSPTPTPVAVGSGVELPLYAGQDVLAGTVTVTDDGTDVTVVYETTDGWHLNETHLAVGDTIPTTKRGQAIPGQFPYGETFAVPTTVASYVVTIADVDDGDGEFLLAAHAVVARGDLLGGGEANPMWATTAVAASQGTAKNGGAIPTTRADPTAVLGAPDYVEGTTVDGQFFSLGFDLEAGGNANDGYVGGTALPDAGYVIVGFDHPVANVDGERDIVLSEVTFNRPSYPLESAAVFVFDDVAGEWVAAGVTVTNQDDVDGPGTGAVGIPVGIAQTSMVMVVDVTDPSIHNGNADGYDLDGVGASYLVVNEYPTQEESAWAGGDDSARFTTHGGWATYVAYAVD